MRASPPARQLPYSALVGAVLVVAALLMLCTQSLVHIPMGVMTILGLVILAREPAVLRDPAVRAVLIIFAGVWVPMLLALVDAVNPARAGKTVFAYVHFLPAAIYLVVLMREPLVRRAAFTGAALLVLLWSLDALMQFYTGRDLIGFPYDGEVLKGMFHPTQRLGLILAVLAPVCLEWIRERAHGAWWGWVALVPVLVVVVLSGKRTAWLMFAFGACLYAWAGLLHGRLRPRARHLVPMLVLVLAGAFALTQSDWAARRAAELSELFAADFETVDAATSYRLSLWRTAGRIFLEHPVNGIGPRGYRYVQEDYAPEAGFWMRHDKGAQTHPHLIAAEVLAETGTVGVLGYLGACAVLGMWLLRRARANPRGVAWLVAAATAVMPLNAHLAFYGSYWAAVIWLLVACGLGEARLAPYAPRGRTNDEWERGETTGNGRNRRV